ncbi:ABC transporter permease [Jatrophihabitans sp. DSM 45814]
MTTQTTKEVARPVRPATPVPWGMSPWRARLRRNESILWGTLCLVLFLILWQVAADVGWVNKLFVSSPTDVGKQLWDYVRTAQFYKDCKTTGLTFIYGLALSLVVGLVLGLAMGFFRRVGYFFDYFISVVYASPRIALVPLLILWFGIGRETGVAMVFLMAVFPIVINTMTGVQTVDPTLMEMARSQKAGKLQLLRTVVIPGSLPQMLSGVRLAIGNGLIGVVVAEFLAGSSSGLGFTMQAAAQSFEAAQLFAGLVVISAFGLIATQLLKLLEKHFQRWRTS